MHACPLLPRGYGGRLHCSVVEDVPTAVDIRRRLRVGSGCDLVVSIACGCGGHDGHVVPEQRAGDAGVEVLDHVEVEKTRNFA
jgi:hypothetical protein